MRPMLASPGATSNGGDRGMAMPSGDGWMHEIKWDGVRLIAEVRDGTVSLRSRSGRDVSAGFPELASLNELATDATLDGEAIVWRDGRHALSHVVDRVHIGSNRAGRAAAARAAEERPVTFAVFDVLRLDQLDITSLALRHRRAALESLWTDGPGRSLVTAYQDGPALLRATVEQGLEGVVSKRWDSPYQPGVRSRDWLKFPHRGTASVVVGGWRPEVGSQRLGAVLVGVPSTQDPTRLRYRGRVGSGLVGRAGEQLAALLATAEGSSKQSPFLEEVPRIDAQGTTWVAPRLVIDVAALNVAALDGAAASVRLRQPSYQRLRPDLSPAEVARA